jgi:hypothetical protein
MMPDETPKPILPKRPYNRKPVTGRTLTKKEKAAEADVEHECLLLTTEERACALISVEKDQESAAIQLGMSLSEVKEILDSAPVQLYLEKIQRDETRELAKVKVRRYRKVGITRTAIEERLMELMMLDPSETKGNIDGQVKAAAALADKFGYAGKADPLAGKSPAELKDIVRKGHSLLIEGNTAVN